MIVLPDEPLPSLAVRVWEVLRDRTPFAVPGAPATDLADVVLRSSGSSATAKNVGHTFDAVTWAAHAGTRVIGAHRWLLLLSPVSAGGFMSLARGTRAPLVWPGLGTRFDARAVGRWYPGGATAVSLVSTQLVRLLDDAPDLLRSMEVVLVGGGPLHPGLRQRCEELNVRAISTYGATETLGGCVYDGLPFDGVSVHINSGEITIDGPNLAATYIPGPRIPRPWPTGDVGHWHDGRLRVLGRKDDIVSVKGVNRHLSEYEADALRRPGVVEAVAVAVADETDGYRVEVFVEDATHRLPRLATGKPDRRELLRRARGDSR